MKAKTRENNLLTARGAEARPVLLFLYCASSSFFKKCQPGWRAASISIFLFFLAPFFPLFSQTYLLNSALSGTTQETCTGTFYDSGGSNNKYGNNENYTVTFCSGSTARIQFSFSQFKLKNGDDMFIYDGPGVSAAQISGSPFSGSDSPETVISSGTCLTFRFVSNNGGNDHGWAAGIECVVNNQGNCPNSVDEDGDGVCEEDDCDDQNPDLPAPAGTPCDDGNPETSGDEIQEDGCTCAGVESITVTGGECSGCDASMAVTFLGCDCVEIEACKDLSNIVLGLGSGSEIKYEDLTGKTASFCSPDGSPILTVWVKAGCYQSGDGPGYGRRFDNPNDCGQAGPCSAPGMAPEVSITGTQSVCPGANTILTASAAGGSSHVFEWSNGLGFGNVKTVSPTTTTTYTVTVVNSAGCTGTAEFTLNVNPPPVVSVSPNVTVCPGSSATLSASATGNSPFTYAWSNSLGNGESKTVTPASTTTYTVTVTDANGCTASKQLTVTVATPPEVASSSAVTICSGVSTGLSVAATGSGPFSYAWSHGLGAGSAHTVSPASTTAYQVTVTDVNGCTATRQITVTVSQTPVANAGPDVTICRLKSATLNASSTGGAAPLTYSWSDGLGSGTTKVVTPLTTKTYTVTVTSSNGCMSTDQVKVTVQNCLEICGNGIDDDGDGLADCDDPECGPTASLSPDVTICPGQSTSLVASATGGNGALTFVWSHNLGTGMSKTVTPAITTTYSVTVTSVLSGCTSVAQATITVADCTEDCTNGIDDDGDGLIDCDDPDCAGITAPVLADDEYVTCPGLPFSDRVTYNDGNLLNPEFSIFQQPANGMVSIDGTGKFYYTPFGTDCASDVFIYQVCNASTGCCSIASVTIHLGDTEPPVLMNLPADITISCDETVPKTNVVMAFDQCPGIFMEFDETSNQNVAGDCDGYQITRTWKATDLCGNSVTGQQVVNVVDLTAPELFRVYTLGNGSKIIAGVAQRVTHDWKYVPFPVNLDKVPVVFTLVNSDNDMAAVNVRQRNISSQGFELRLWEEQAADGKHGPESVAWIAIEPGSQNGNFTFEAATLANVNHAIQTLNFTENFGSAPMVISSIQTTKDTDPVNLRHASLSSTSLDLFLQEETSADAETNHLNETIGFMAIKKGAKLKDKKHHEFGEAGVLALTNAWATVHFNKKYTKPVVVFGGVSNNDPDPVNVRVRNVTATGFEVRLQEWNYLDGNHGTETVAWMVVEGSIPGDKSYYCSGSASDLQKGVNVFSVDNCDTQVAFDFAEIKATQANGKITTRTWTAIDDCGNTSVITRFDTCQVAAVQAKALLYGAVIGNNNGIGIMRDDLRKKKLVPKFEPFSKMPKFPHVNYDTPANNGSGGGGNGKVTICHGAGTASENTLEISASALAAHLAHGDVEGACASDNGTGYPPNAHAAAYKTIADGNWSSPATWEGGLVPPTGNIAFKEISITHHVTVQTASITLKNNSKLWVTGGSLTFQTGNFIIDKADVTLTNATLNMLPTAGDFKLINDKADLKVFNSEINVGKNFQATDGKRWLENVCLNVDGQYLTSLLAKDTLINVTGVAGQGFVNGTGGSVYLLNSRVRVLNGNFVNQLGATLKGENLLLLIENGSLTNLGAWTLEVTQYCVSNLVTIPLEFLPVSEDCTNIANEFDPAGCSIAQILADLGTDPAYEPASNSGILDPVLLDDENGEAIIDWVLIELRNPDNDQEIVDYATGVVKSDGRIVSETGEDTILFPDAMEGNYFVTIRHRNHLGMMTDVPFYLTTMNVPEIDFTDLSLPVRGGNTAGRIYNGKRTLWPGDFNGDGKVVYQGPFNDVFYLFSRIVADSTNSNQLANFIIEAYDSHDLNLDGKVIYQGPQNDRSTLLYHAILGHPGNTSLLANFILSEKLP